MAKIKENDKRFSISISGDRLRAERNDFVIDLRKKELENNTALKKDKKKKLNNKKPSTSFWKSSRVMSSLPFFFKPDKVNYHGIFLDKRAEELRDKFSDFEAKHFRTSLFGKISLFFLVLFLIFLPFKILAFYQVIDLPKLKNNISNNSHLAINDLISAASAASRLDLKLASSDFSGATIHFLQAENDLKNIDDSLLQLAGLFGNQEMKLAASGKKFLQAGALASSMGKHLSLAIDGIFSKQDPKESLKIFSDEGKKALSYSKDLSKVLADIDPKVLPEEYRQQFLDLRQKAFAVDEILREIIPKANKFGELLGVQRNQRYLLIFQNNTEMRGSGGFMGSYALVDFSGGKIKNLEIPGGGTYDTKGGLKEFIKSPVALRLIAPRWYFWDSNWFPDWALSAQNIRLFYEKSGGPTVDGVIAFTPDIISNLLEITGPIDMTQDYGVIIDANNFYELTQQITEKDNLVRDGDLSVDDFVATATSSLEKANSAIEVKQDLDRNINNKPKKIIGDLTAKILVVLPDKIDRNNIVKIISLVESSLSSKQLMFNFSNQDLQAEMEKRNWAGRQENTSGDYLMVVNTNISGGKSDYKMEEKIEQITEIKEDGEIINTVKITRKHNGVKGEKLFGMKNVDWLRIYVPEGSKLISATGFKAPDSTLFKRAQADWGEIPLLANGEGSAEIVNGTMIYQENKKTVFANWLITDPGSESVVELKYSLAKKIAFPKKDLLGWKDDFYHLIFGENEKLSTYSLLVQKQPGAKPSSYTSVLKLDSQQYINIWSYPEESKINSSGWKKDSLLDQDLSFGAILKGNN